MDIPTLKEFFMWCTILNGGLFLFWFLIISVAPDLVYRTQKRWCAMSREQFDAVRNGFLGMFKLFVIGFNLVPFLALLIMT